MKLKLRFIKYFLLLISAPILFTSCEKELDHPPKKELNQDAVMTLSEIRDLYDGEAIELDSGSNLFAVINMDESTGNIYRSLFVQDNTAAINLRLTSTSFFQEGDSVRISLDGTTLDSFNGMLQLDNIDPDNNIIKQASDKHLTPEVVTIPDITPEKQGQLVKLEKVQFASDDAGETYAYADEQQSENRVLMNIDGNTIIVRTSGFADFADELTPEGSGSLIAIVSQYFDDMQLFIRNTDEVVMEDERFEIDLPDGTFDDPYSVANAIAVNTGNDIWVEGYITGVMETTVDPFAPSFEPPFETTTNVIIADDPDETSLSNSLIVQLPIGDVRSAVNLVDNPGNHGKEIKLLGDLEAYFGRPGMRNTSGYWMEDDGIIPEDSFWSVDFSDESDGIQPFTDHNIIGDQNWEWQFYNDGSAVMSGYSEGSNYENENWLISPSIDLTEKNNVSLEFIEVINFLTSYDDLQVLIATDFNENNPNESGTWELFENFNRPPGNSWDPVNSGLIDISRFDGETIHIAFKYTSDTSGAATWQISEVQLFETTK